MIPFFRFHRAPRGTVYLMQSRVDATLFKVGFTKRKTIERRAELNRVARDDMRIVFTVSLPWARQCEGMVLRRLRRDLFRKGDRRGTEWFRLRRRETIETIIAKLERSARHIELIAKLKLSWPSGAEARTFRSKHRPQNV